MCSADILNFFDSATDLIPGTVQLRGVGLWFQKDRAVSRKLEGLLGYWVSCDKPRWYSQRLRAERSTAGRGAKPVAQGWSERCFHTTAHGAHSLVRWKQSSEFESLKNNFQTEVLEAKTLHDQEDSFRFRGDHSNRKWVVDRKLDFAKEGIKSAEPTAAFRAGEMRIPQAPARRCRLRDTTDGISEF